MPYDFKTTLSEGYAKRQSGELKFTLKAYADELGLTAQTLDKVLKGRVGLSKSKAEMIARRLDLKGRVKELFVASVEAKHSRSLTARALAKKKVEQLESELAFQTLDEKSFAKISNWVDMVCCMILDLDDFDFDEQKIAKALQVSEHRVRESYRKLADLGLIAKNQNGRWKRTNSLFSFDAEGESKALRNYYRDLWSRAEPSLDDEALARRNFSATILSLGDDDLDFVRDEISAFHKSLIKKISLRPGKAERIYSLAVQFFPLLQKGFP